MSEYENTTKFDPKSRYYNAGNIETLDVIKAKLTSEQYKGYLLGNALKYQCRMNFKGTSNREQLRDAEKAANYTAWLRDAIQAEEPTIGQKLHDNITQEVGTITDVYKDVFFATSVLTENMQADEGLAWSWYCDITHPILNEGVERITANKAAAKIMKTLFDIDITQHEHFKLIMKSKCIKATMDFGTALEALKNGKTIARLIWNQGVVMFMTEEQYRNSEGDNVKVGAIVYATSDGHCVNWFASHADMLADDWIVK